jgi:hypothetical protein
MADNVETQRPRKKIEKPANPLAQKPGQNYGGTKYEKEKAYVNQTVEELKDK